MGKICPSNKTVIRSIFIDDDKIYSGSYKEFGYWKRMNGKMEYFSLTRGKNIFQGGSDNEEIWKIFKYKDRLYFQTFNEVFIYDGKAIKKIEFPSQISYCYLIDNEIYVATVREGIYMMEGEKFVKRKNWKILEENVIHHIEKYQGKVYIFTKNNGVFVVIDGNLVPWSHPLNEVIKKKFL